MTDNTSGGNDRARAAVGGRDPLAGYDEKTRAALRAMAGEANRSARVPADPPARAAVGGQNRLPPEQEKAIREALGQPQPPPPPAKAPQEAGEFVRRPQPDDTVPVEEARAKWKEPVGSPVASPPAGSGAPLERFSPEVQKAVLEALGAGKDGDLPKGSLPSDREIAQILRDKQEGDRKFYERIRDRNLQDLKDGGLSGDLLREQSAEIRRRFDTNMQNLPRSAVTELSMHHAAEAGLSPDAAWERAKADYARITGDTRPLPGLNEGLGVRTNLHTESPSHPAPSSVAGSKLKGGVLTTAALAVGTGLVIGLTTHDAQAGAHAALESANPLQGAVDEVVARGGITTDVATVAAENVAGAAGAGAGALLGAQAGAALGNVAGPIGTAAGGLVGGIVGGVAGEAAVNLAIQKGREHYDSAVDWTSRSMESVADAFNSLGGKSPAAVPASPHVDMSPVARTEINPGSVRVNPVRPAVQQNRPSGP